MRGEIRLAKILGAFVILSATVAVAQEDTAPSATDPVLFRGAVYEGRIGELDRPVPGVTVSLYGGDASYPTPGVELGTVQTNAQGRFEFTVRFAEGHHRYYHLRQVNLDGYLSIAAQCASPLGAVRTEDWIEFAAPAVGDTISGIRFWDMGPRPDLLVGVSDPVLTESGDTLVLAIQAWNSGSAPASGSTVRAASNDWTGEVTIPPLGQREVAKATIRLPLSEARRGERHTFRVEVDPDQKIPEFNEGNNEALANPYQIPNLPDLVIASSSVGLVEEGQTVEILTQIANRGDVSSEATSVQASSGAWSATAALPALDGGAGTSIRIGMPIRPEHRGLRHRFTIVVDPERRVREKNEENNSADAPEIELPSLPDLVIRAPRAEITAGEKKLRIVLEVENLGGVEAPASVVSAHSGRWRGTTTAGRLATGGRQALEMELAIPKEERGASHTFVLQIDPENRIQELNESNNTTEALPIRISDLPDLVIRQTAFDILGDGKTLRIEIQVANVGGAKAPETTVRAGVEGWNETAAVRSLAAGEAAQVEVWLEIPPERRGKDHTFEVDVDPEGRIIELEESNNSIRKSTAPIPDLPDLTLTVSRLGFADKGRSLLIVGRAENLGGASAPASVVRVRSGEWEERGIVDAMTPGDTAHVEMRIEIPDEQRGLAHSFDVVIDPADEIRELDEENNAVRTPGIDIPKRASLWLYAAIVGGLAFLLIVGLLIRRTIRKRGRKDWQEDAVEGDLPEPQRPGTYHCRKIEVDLDTRRGRMTEIIARARPRDASGPERSIRISGTPIEALNEAIKASRGKTDDRLVRNQVSPVAQGIVHRIEDWLAGEGDRFEIDLQGQLEGGRATYEFILYHCERKGSADIWIEEDRWESRQRESRYLSLGRPIRVPPESTGTAAIGVEEVTSDLIQFVQKI